MTVIDANILLYVYDDTAPQHARVRSWLEETQRRPEDIGITWLALWAFVRISTNPRLIRTALPIQEAFAIVREILNWPGVVMVGPGPKHAEILERLAVDAQTMGPVLTDAVLAAIAVEQGATVASTDRDFARFDGLRWVNPLAR